MSTSVEDYIQEVFGKEALETMPPEIRSIVLEMGKILSEYQTDRAKEFHKEKSCLICGATEDLVIVSLSSTEEILVDTRTYCRSHFRSEAKSRRMFAPLTGSRLSIKNI